MAGAGAALIAHHRDTSNVKRFDTLFVFDVVPRCRRAPMSPCRAHKKKGPASGAFQLHGSAARADRQAAAAVNCQFFGKITASMA